MCSYGAGEVSYTVFVDEEFVDGFDLFCFFFGVDCSDDFHGWLFLPNIPMFL